LRGKSGGRHEKNESGHCKKSHGVPHTSFKHPNGSSPTGGPLFVHTLLLTALLAGEVYNVATVLAVQHFTLTLQFFVQISHGIPVLLLLVWGVLWWMLPARLLIRRLWCWDTLL
jgi:hypothetical protein